MVLQESSHFWDIKQILNCLSFWVYPLLLLMPRAEVWGDGVGPFSYLAFMFLWLILSSQTGCDLLLGLSFVHQPDESFLLCWHHWRFSDFYLVAWHGISLWVGKSVVSPLTFGHAIIPTLLTWRRSCTVFGGANAPVEILTRSTCPPENGLIYLLSNISHNAVMSHSYLFILDLFKSRWLIPSVS